MKRLLNEIKDWLVIIGAVIGVLVCMAIIMAILFGIPAAAIVWIIEAIQS